MISCTEFIPAYNELFSFLDTHYGHQEVERFWSFLFAPTGKGIPLINFARKDGLRGCWNYWCGTLSEEASDCTRYFNEKAGWIFSNMHHCPSKGRLLKLAQELGVEPYYDYCSHCDYYRAHLEAVGLGWIRCHVDVDKASCSSLIYDPKVFRGVMRVDENTEIMRITPEEKEYFHPDFHSSLNMSMDYLGGEHGEAVLTEYLEQYTEHVYAPVLRAMKEDPLGALENKLREIYRMEKAEDALTLERTDRDLRVTVHYCPAVSYLKKTGRTVSQWFPLSTRVVMQTLAHRSGLQFRWERYVPQTGAAEYSFSLNP